MTYIDTHPSPGVENPNDAHSWQDFTRRRLEWLYGPAQSIERRAQTQADLAAWRNLGRRPAA